jgi:RNA polymerase sigma factor for flagellar operon FliA|tara:strand:+ start:9985 stop:10686 length:702 start_codon:yes stop_codon:yes gene_type:complete
MKSGLPFRATESSSKLLPEHYSLVKRTALYLKARLPNSIEVDDLIQSGLGGLIQAQQSYDAGKEVAFDLYAKTRIKGAMLDEVRRLSYATRTTVSLKRQQASAFEHLSNRLNRNPTNREMASYLGKDMDTFEKERLIASGSETVSIEAQPSMHSEEEDTTSDPAHIYDQSELLIELQKHIENLPERTRLIISLYYTEEMNLKEIAAILEISESRVSQILSETAGKLKDKLALD